MACRCKLCASGIFARVEGDGGGVVVMVAHSEDWHPLSVLCLMAGMQLSNWLLNHSALPGSR